MKNSLLISVAVAALLGGAEVAAAQSPSGQPGQKMEQPGGSKASPGASSGAAGEHQGQAQGASPQGKPPAAAQSGQHDEHGPSGRMGQSEDRNQPGKTGQERQGKPSGTVGQGEEHNQSGKTGQGEERNKSGTTGQAEERGKSDRMGQGEERNKSGQTGREERNKSGTVGQGQERNQPGATGRPGTAQQPAPTENRMGQQPGSNTNVDVTLSSEQRTRIRETVIRRSDAPRMARSNINFELNVGTVVPRSVHVVTLPEEVITIHPAWRGYEYFLVGDEIVVVEPDTLRIVAVLPA